MRCAVARAAGRRLAPPAPAGAGVDAPLVQLDLTSVTGRAALDAEGLDGLHVMSAVTTGAARRARACQGPRAAVSAAGQLGGRLGVTLGAADRSKRLLMGGRGALVAGHTFKAAVDRRLHRSLVNEEREGPPRCRGGSLQIPIGVAGKALLRSWKLDRPRCRRDEKKERPEE
jgi:hypothetical protein